jgi:hypothetical protein
MPRRINWTGRSRISRTDVRIHIQEASPPVFSVDVNLNSYGLPADAAVVVEAYRGVLWRRFDFGTVGLPIAREALTLDAFGESDGVLFRLKVLDAGGAGRILAEADRLRAVEREQESRPRKSLLDPVADDLGDQVYRLDVSFETGPQLILNRALPDWRGTAKSAVFRALVYPTVLRDVLKVALENRDDDEESWVQHWLRFAQSLPGTVSPPEETEGQEAAEEWIADVVDAFCRQHQLRAGFIEATVEASGS